MKRYPTVLALVLTSLLCLAGCGRTRYPSYYTLNLPPAPDPIAQEPAHTSIAVREFQSPSYLRQGPIVYRETPEQIGFYEYHRWAADPRVLLTTAVVDRLRASGHYSAVSVYDGHAGMEYVLSGKLEKLEEVDNVAGTKVEVAISAQITRVSTGAAVWSNSVSEVGIVSEHNVPGVVSQMNRSTEQAISKLLSTIPDHLNDPK
jgi:ABC-type uncharacterized transport system auxiliary subunit